MDLPFIYHSDYVVPLPNEHRFPMQKFRLLQEMLLSNGVAEISQFHTPERPPPNGLN